MENLWRDEATKNLKSDLDLRVYTSNLLGRNDELVLHGGGNTSVKTKVNGKDILFVKGSGWDLENIKARGFSPVKLDILLKMARLKTLSDSDMVREQKNAMIDKNAPNPSVEAILHAIIPFKFVDHTHADAIVTISNSKGGKKNIKQLFPDFLVIPYVMPGFILAQTIYNESKNIDWSKCKGIILHNHGIFTFDNDAKKSYTKMIEAVTKAEEFLQIFAKITLKTSNTKKNINTKQLQNIISKHKGFEVVSNVNISDLAYTYASQNNLKFSTCRGVLTPEHIIRTKRIPLVLEDDNFEDTIKKYEYNYIEYFKEFSTDEICLNPSPNYVIIKDFGIVSFGKNKKEAGIINDIIEHTMQAVLQADMLGGYKSINKKDSFDMEYWELEQAKLKK